FYFFLTLTEKIDKMNSVYLQPGAYGGKINGSGAEGTMFTLLSKSESRIKFAIEETTSICNSNEQWS
ncbi:hypothetical protein LCGC14_1050260, partial [marine sediment metagenome]